MTTPSRLARLAGLLRCPHCGADLEPRGRAMSCARGHGFDGARQGYVNLLPGGARTGTGDTAAMVAARAVFLGAGHYAHISDAVAAAAVACLEDAAGATAGSTGLPGSPQPDGCCLDLGAGTGHHLARVLGALPGRVGLALDVSRYAAARAARAHPRIGAVVCDAWGPLPVRPAVAAVALSVFAPRGGAEIARVLRPGGALVVVTPTTAHLAELVGTLGLVSVDARKPERLARQLDPYLSPAGTHLLERGLALSHRDVEALVSMGPSAHHTDPAAVRARVAALPDPVPVTTSVTVSVHRRP